jgi:signal transduction histidine kinase/FixJ family two-component response regulator
MKAITGKFSSKSVLGKILAGFLLAFAAILLAFSITRLAFTDMLSKVDELSEPSGKLTLLNKVFLEITTLDQLQRAEAIRDPRKPQKAFLNQSQRTIALIDSMSLLEWDSVQHVRIRSMKDILRDRDSLFFSYLKLKSNLVDNRSLSKRIDTLSAILEKKRIEIDSSGLITTEKRTTTTYVQDTLLPPKDDRSFFGKIFGGKKKKTGYETEPVQMQVQEELQVVVDTAAIASQNRALLEVEKIVLDLEADQRTQSKKLLERELELINANGQLVSQLLGILRQVETEELATMQARSSEAGLVVSESIKRISILLLAFFLGAALLVYLIWTDISNSNFYKRQLEKARDEAEELSQIKQRFLANMSHEIRTPLQSIIGFAEHIKTQNVLDREAVDAIHSSSEHLLHIVNEVLDYSRISSGNFTLAREDFRLMSVIREVEAAMRIQTDKKGLTLLLDMEQTGDYVLSGDSFRLRQILYNVLGNAIKFTTKGFVKLSVRTTEEATGKILCRFEVMDSGIGIRKDDLEKIFNQFEQADASIARDFGGTGLGLTIVKSLIEAQGGKLEVDSEPGFGSTFSITLVYHKSTAPDAEKPGTPMASTPLDYSGKVLVVDDDPMILRLCGLVLKKNGVEHILFDDPEELLNRQPEKEVTHIFMDIRMPKLNGVELCKALKKKYPTSTRFIALTAHVFQQEKQHLYDQGFDKVLTKPFHESDLLDLLGLVNGGQVQPSTNGESYGIDLEPLRKLTLYDESLFQSVISQFTEETTDELYKLEAAATNHNRTKVRDIVHKLAGRIGQIGVLPLSMRLREIETRIETGEEFDTVIPSVTKEIEEIRNIIRTLESMPVTRGTS